MSIIETNIMNDITDRIPTWNVAYRQKGNFPILYPKYINHEHKNIVMLDLTEKDGFTINQEKNMVDSKWSIVATGHHEKKTSDQDNLSFPRNPGLINMTGMIGQLDITLTYSIPSPR